MVHYYEEMNQPLQKVLTNPIAVTLVQKLLQTLLLTDLGYTI